MSATSPNKADLNTNPISDVTVDQNQARPADFLLDITTHPSYDATRFADLRVMVMSHFMSNTISTIVPRLIYGTLQEKSLDRSLHVWQNLLNKINWSSLEIQTFDGLSFFNKLIDMFLTDELDIATAREELALLKGDFICDNIFNAIMAAAQANAPFNPSPQYGQMMLHGNTSLLQ